ncbi:MAG: hypothetical protein AB8B53_02675 [Flavobacteriales bacterium]
MALSKITSQLIQCVMTNDMNRIKTLVTSGKVIFDGKDSERFLIRFEKILNAAHKRAKGDWNLEMEPADWLKNKTAIVYDFYNGNGNQSCISLVVEELGEKVWVEVLK